MESLKKERVSVRAVEAIRRIISEEHFKPGDKLYSEHEFSKQLQISRASVREAIRILEITGTVTVKHGKGVYLNDALEQKFSTFKQWVHENQSLLLEHFEVRLLIEPHAAQVAAREISSKEMRELRDCYNEYLKAMEAGDMQSAVSCDSSFHLKVAKASHNRTLEVLMKTMAQSLNEGWITSLNTPGRLEHTIEEHERIMAAIEGHDGEAAGEAMRRHLRTALRDIEAYTVSKLER